MPLDKGKFSAIMFARKMTNDFFTLKGQIVRKIQALNGDSLSILTDKYEYNLYHAQDCCEYVRIVKIIGDIDNILNEEIIFAEEDGGANDPDWYIILDDILLLLSKNAI
jgi:hypothetical protein